MREQNPLITFVVFAYEQDKYVREAISGAFAQTYSPLEIVLSDDCSGDRTYEIMCEMAHKYNGPHKIILNRNKSNLGVGRHINRVMDISRGEIVVGSAGDDVSMPERVSEIYAAWLRSDKSAYSIDSAFQIIDEDGGFISRHSGRNLPCNNQLEYFSETVVAAAAGTSHAWHRDIFRVFGPLPSITCEDVALPPRSMLLGTVVSLNKELVRYRIHHSNTYNARKKRNMKESISRTIYYLKDRIVICDDILRCIDIKKQKQLSRKEFMMLDRCVERIERNKVKCQLKIYALGEGRVWGLVYMIRYAFEFGLQREDLPVLAYSISRHLYAFTRILFNWWTKRTPLNSIAGT